MGTDRHQDDKDLIALEIKFQIYRVITVLDNNLGY